MGTVTHALPDRHPAGASLAVLDLGAAEPVRVYLGGLGSASTVAFAEVTGHPELAGHGRHILIDLIGSGWSDHDDTFGHTIDEHARTVIGVLDELALREVTLIGHSLGGSIAISLAAQRPDLVGHLIVAEPNLDPGSARSPPRSPPPTRTRSPRPATRASSTSCSKPNPNTPGRWPAGPPAPCTAPRSRCWPTARQRFAHSWPPSPNQAATSPANAQPRT
ncbi:alpha/beta fold hydrolase [Paractinoplanes durhamensis]|uniref:alpha/beta fold hydrolase n=1 Tax=Paractinoplanes durhamensis TaxID=113563 RepID=UPI003626D096